MHLIGKDVWEIVKKADRPNIGLCLDTFQSAGGEWGDPRTNSGLVEDVKREEVEACWKQSCKELAATIPSNKIFLLQISDAYRMDYPIEDKFDDSALRPRGQWSHDYRPLPYDGGYLPVEDFTRAVFETGFRGWCSSIEVFDGRGPEKYEEMGSFAGKAMEALRRLLDEAGSS
jgi:sugar phosphate isomerase/epimerase